MKKILIVFSLLILLSSCFWDKEKEKNSNEKENSVKKEKTELANFLDVDYVNDKDTENLEKFLNAGEFIKSNESIDNILKSIKDKNTKESRRIEIRLTQLKISNLLNNGTYSYKEKEAVEQAKKIRNKLIIKYPKIISTVDVQYSLGYSEEILKNYKKALKHYNFALDYVKKDDYKSFGVILNQIGHLYDLKGDTKKALEYYEKAYEKDPKNEMLISNLARNYAKDGDFKKSKEFLIKGLNTTNKPLKSEVYFSLSSIELELNKYDPNIDQTIEYAKKSIENYSKYPMGYYALAKAYYILNDETKIDIIKTNLKKSMELGPKSYTPHELLGLVFWDEKNFNEAIKELEIAKNLVDKDMILMDNERKEIKENILASISILEEINKKENQENEVFKYLITNLNKPAYLDNILLQLKRKNNGYLGKIGEKLKEEIKKLK